MRAESERVIVYRSGFVCITVFAISAACLDEYVHFEVVEYFADVMRCGTYFVKLALKRIQVKKDVIG